MRHAAPTAAHTAHGDQTRQSSQSNRRDFLRNSGALAAAGGLASTLSMPAVHAAEDNTIRIALVGCGGRGTGAAVDALSVEDGPIQLVAMADVVEQNVTNKYNTLAGLERISGRVDVPPERRFVGF